VEIVRGQVRSVDVRQEGTRVLVLEGGRLVLELPWEAALTLARALQVQGKRAEEEAKALEIVADQAILTRLGAPIGLTSRPDLLREAAREAAWDSRLRRYIPPGRARGIGSGEVVGAPRVIRHKARKVRRKT